jgi:S1-C subfamily serine protease
VTAVRDGSPADDAGLRVGDRITAINGDEIAAVEELQELVAESEPGETLALTYLRDGERRSADVKLGTRPG